jgi:hypothetical protein
MVWDLQSRHLPVAAGKTEIVASSGQLLLAVEFFVPAACIDNSCRKLGVDVSLAQGRRPRPDRSLCGKFRYQPSAYKWTQHTRRARNQAFLKRARSCRSFSDKCLIDLLCGMPSSLLHSTAPSSPRLMRPPFGLCCELSARRMGFSSPVAQSWFPKQSWAPLLTLHLSPAVGQWTASLRKSSRVGLLLLMFGYMRVAFRPMNC